MSTTFAIVSKNEEGEFERIDIAHRSSIGNGLVGIKWFDISLRDLYNILRVDKFNKLGFKGVNLSDVHVEAMDNTAQGVKTVGDLMVLDKFGTLKDENYYNSIYEEFNKKIDIEEVDKSESDLKNESNTDKIKALEHKIEVLEDFNIMKLAIDFVNTKHDLIERIEAVETLFNNINEINYINNKTKGDKNETK